MKNNILIPGPALSAREIVDQHKLFLLGAGLTMTSAFMQHAVHNGHYIIPRFLRHHIASAGDGMAAASFFNIAQMRLSQKMGWQVKSRPVLSSAFAMATELGWESLSAHGPNRRFDWNDVTVCAASVALYLGYSCTDQIMKLIKRHEARELRP